MIDPHTLWAASQLAPGEGIEDGVARISAILRLAAPAPVVPLTDERAAFEAWIRKDSGDLTTFGSGSNMHYRNSAVNNAWTGWQVRAALGGKTP